MDRKAKNKISYRDLIDYILEDFDDNKVPNCKCPVDEFDDYMPITFCSTKCNSICWRFRRFIYVYNYCDEINCDWENPCVDCLDRVKECKDMINQFRAIFYKRQRDPSVNKRCRIMTDFSHQVHEEMGKSNSSKESISEPNLDDIGKNDS